MKASHERYGRARDALLEAQAAFAAATEELRSAEGDVRAEFDRAWLDSLETVQVAAADQGAALDHLAAVQVAMGETARARWLAAGGAGLVFLTDEEQARVDAAEAALTEAESAHREVQEQHKAGVTVEQLVAAAARAEPADGPSVG